MAKMEYVVPEALDGARLDKALVELAEGASRASVKRAIESGGVRVNGRRRSKGDVVAVGDRIEVAIEHRSDVEDVPVGAPGESLVVRLETDDLIVVDKPAGQPTAPIRAGESGTLVNALVARYPEIVGIGYTPRESGLMHRLDTGTSGLVLVARSAHVFDALQRVLKADGIEKRYLVICSEEGLADVGSIEIPVANHPKDQKRVYACVHPRDVIRYAPREAKTDFRVLERRGGWALVEASVARAVRHQIRVHFAAFGHPLLGDTLYGGAEHPLLSRHALHASRIAFRGAEGLPPFDVESPLPDDMRAAFYAASSPS